MAKIIINNEKEVKGYLNVMRKKDNAGNILISGSLLTHRYIEDISHISTERYEINDVDIYAEEFASNDFMIRYEFFAKAINIIGGETNLTNDIINKIEEEYFKEEQDELFHKEVYEKWN